MGGASDFNGLRFVNRYHGKRQSSKPVMVVAFAGWNDAGDAASSAVTYLEQLWSATPHAHIESEEFFDFTTRRPVVEFSACGERRVAWPNTHVSFAEGVLPGRDVVIVRGVEPQLKWRTFCDAILSLAEELDVSLIVTLGALLADVPHTRPTVVYGSFTNPVQIEGAGFDIEGLEPSTYEGPTGIIGVINSEAAVRGLACVSLWASVPTYIPGAESPKAALALLKRLRSMIGAEFDTHDLQAESQEYVRQVNEHLEEDEDTRLYIEDLERHYDDSHELSPKQLIDEVERFLKKRGNTA